MAGDYNRLLTVRAWNMPPCNKIEKYKMDEKKEFDFISIYRPEICVWNILQCALRMWNRKIEPHDVE